MKTENRVGKIQIAIDGVNQTKLLNTFVKYDIAFFDVNKSSSASMTLWLYHKQSAKAFAILSEMCYNTRILVQDIKTSMLAWSLKRAGAILGCIVFLTVLLFSNSFVWRVDIVGLETVPLNLVQNILSEQHASFGAWTSHIDRASIKKNILELDNVVDASIDIRGTTLVVTVFENFETITPDPGTPSSIYSKHDAVVSRVIVSEGTAVVKPGDIVAKGAELVSPNIYDTNGQVLTTVYPQARVYGDVTYSDSSFFSQNQIVSKRTGNKVRFNDLSLFGLHLSRKHNPYKYYETEKTSGYVSGKNLLPIHYDNITYYELDVKEVEVDPQTYSQLMVQKMLQNLQLKAGTSNLTQKVDLREVPGGWRVDLFVTAEILLS